MAIIALLDKGLVTSPHCVIESHFFEADLAGLVKSVILALFLLHGFELSDRTKVTCCNVLVPALFDLCPLQLFHIGGLLNAD